MTTAFVNLTPQTIENGALYFFKGSHKISLDQIDEETERHFEERYGSQKHGSEDLSLQIKNEFLRRYQKLHDRVDLIGNGGDIWFSHPLALHASDENCSKESRDIAVIRYNSIINLPSHPRKEGYWCSRDYRPLTPFSP